MASAGSTDVEFEIRELVQRMNEAWVKGHPEELASFFSEDIVMVHPDFAQRTEGRDACVASYADFCTQADIQDFKLGDLAIDVSGDTAVATYSYDIAYEMGGERFNDKGRDVFVFSRSSGKWQAVWRTMIISQTESVN
ncbi:MAG TPA: nuclear transport factor 2 family protein [Blastocatellia bacterium]|nr:nuclear transport factor 2 family protein [Blastocatellia bacterium]